MILIYNNNNILPDILFEKDIENNILKFFNIKNLDLFNTNLYYLLTNNNMKANIQNNYIKNYEYKINTFDINNINNYIKKDFKKYFLVINKDNLNDNYTFNKFYYDKFKNKIMFDDEQIDKISYNIDNFINNLNILSYLKLI